MKKRKKSFGAEDGDGEESNEKNDRERDSGKANGCNGSGMNGSHKVKPSLGLGLGLEDPDVRLAAEALGDLRAGRLLRFTNFKDHIEFAYCAYA